MIISHGQLCIKKLFTKAALAGTLRRGHLKLTFLTEAITPKLARRQVLLSNTSHAGQMDLNRSNKFYNKRMDAHRLVQRGEKSLTAPAHQDEDGYGSDDG